ncbi:MAG: hypothetical protein ACYCRE_08455 [Acidobacteriaceae bacterium]
MWEAYDTAWYKDDFHASLRADNLSGYRTSPVHGWSTGIMPWLMEQVLGIHATGSGFSTVDIRPDLIDLQWAKGGDADSPAVVRHPPAFAATSVKVPSWLVWNRAACEGVALPASAS